jgi:hypothetical protein
MKTVKPSFSEQSKECIYTLSLILVIFWICRYAVISSTALAQVKVPDPESNSFQAILYRLHSQLGCAFTLEYRGSFVRLGNSKVSAWLNGANNKFQSRDIADLVSKLKTYLEDDFIVEQDQTSPNVIHIIEKYLATNMNYALNKKVSLSYSGDYDGLISAIGKQVPRLREGGGDDGGMETTYQRDIIAKVHATNETVRSILTGCLPTIECPGIAWRTIEVWDGELWCEVQFGQFKPNAQK